MGSPGRHLPLVSSVAAEAAQKEETLTNKSVIELHELNLNDGVLIEKIKTSRCDFDVSISGLKQLKEAKVSDPVIQVMISTKRSTLGGEIKSIVAADANDPNAPHESGVWLCENSAAQKKMVKMDAEVYRMWTGGGPFGGASRAVLSGIKAPLQVSSRRPVFFMYLGDGGEGIMRTMNPNELPLAKLDLKEKTKERLLVIGSASPFAGYNSGIKKESLRAVDAVNVSSGIYRVTPKEDLADGEYAFCPTLAGGMTAGKMFCFGIHLK